MIVSCSHDGLVRVWDTESGQCLKSLVDQENPAMSFVGFSESGRYIVTATLDSIIRIWDFVSSQAKKTYKGHLNTRYVVNVEMSNREVISGGEDGVVTVWETQSREVKQRIQSSSEPVLSVAVCRDADGREWLAAGGLDTVVRIYTREQ